MTIAEANKSLDRPILCVEVDVREGRAYAINANGVTTTIPQKAFRSRDIGKAQRLANALKLRNPIIVNAAS